MSANYKKSLNEKELLTSLRKVGFNKTVTADNIKNPTQEFVMEFYLGFLDKVLSKGLSDLIENQLRQVAQFSMNRQALIITSVYDRLNKFLKSLNFDYLKLEDIINPDRVRTKNIMQFLLNYMSFSSKIFYDQFVPIHNQIESKGLVKGKSQAELNQIISKIADLDDRKNIMILKFETVLSKQNEYKERLNELKSLLVEKEVDLEKGRKLLEKDQEKILELNDFIKNNLEKREDLESLLVQDYQELMRTYTTLASEKHELNARYEELQTEINNYKNKIERINQMNIPNQEFGEKITKLHAKLTSIKRLENILIKKRSEALEVQTNVSKKLLVQLKKFESDNQKFVELYDIIKKRFDCTSLSEEIEELKKKFDNYNLDKNEINKAVCEVNNSKNSLSNYKKQLTDLIHRYNDMRESCKKQKNELFEKLDANIKKVLNQIEKSFDI